MILRPSAHGGYRGFSLIELLVVVAIIALLAVIAIPVTGNAIKAANRAKCMGNLRTIYTYLQAYAQEHNGQMPEPSITQGSSYKQPGTNFTLALSPYIPTVADRRVFYCPAHKGEQSGSLFPYTYTDTRWNTGGISYHYYSLSNNNSGIPLRVTDANDQLLMSDKFNNDANKPSVVTSSKGADCTHPDGLNLMRLNGSIEFSKYGVDISTW